MSLPVSPLFVAQLPLKRDVMVLWHKIVQNIESFMTSSLSRVFYVIKQCSVLYDVEIRVRLFLAHLTEICTWISFRALPSNLRLKIRDKNNLSEKKPFL